MIFRITGIINIRTIVAFVTVISIIVTRVYMFVPLTVATVIIICILIASSA